MRLTPTASTQHRERITIPRQLTKFRSASGSSHNACYNQTDPTTPEIDVFCWPPVPTPNEISLLPAAGPGGEPRNEAHETLHAVAANFENSQQTFFRPTRSWHE